MIILKAANHNHVLKPTIFPDGTSQVWKLPEDVLRCSSVRVAWRYEHEREILDLLSLRKLMDDNTMSLHIPYMPYARQDKEVSNNSTYNLAVFADLINSMKFRFVSTFDVHNPDKTRILINKLINVSANDFHADVISESKPDFLVFPDAGAASRYSGSLDYGHLPFIICDKERDPWTGDIIGHKIISTTGIPERNGIPYHYLIIDDLCDGGATFISVAKMLRSESPEAVGRVDLCVSHGLFSKGREHLLTNGINKVYTTDSLTKNEDGYNV